MSATSRVRSTTAVPCSPHQARNARRMTPATPHSSRRGVAQVPSMRAKRLACVAAITRPRSSCMRPSSMAPSSHSARASTCSRRFRCLRPASAPLRARRMRHQPSRTPFVAASRRPGGPGRGRHDARWPGVARRPVATLADAARQDELHDAARLARNARDVRAQGVEIRRRKTEGAGAVRSGARSASRESAGVRPRPPRSRTIRRRTAGRDPAGRSRRRRGR